MKSLQATLTVRLPPPALRRLKARARAIGVTPSELVRAALEREVGPLADEPTAAEMTREWIGVLRGPAPDGRDARNVLETWNPDRRG
ncbi:MAG TPA: CopG family transcriptional regulator [Polyangia bacterium]|nr:CopG family transcriptional regulator [Polyangia bacterium]